MTEFEKIPSQPVPLSGTTTSTPIQARRKRACMGVLVALLMIVLLIGGVALVFVQRHAALAGSGSHLSVQSKRAGTLVATEDESDDSFVLGWSPDSRYVLTTDLHAIYSWDTKTGRQSTLYYYSTFDPYSLVRWAPDKSSRVAIATGANVTIIDAKTGATLLNGPTTTNADLLAWYPSEKRSETPLQMTALAWSPDGNEIATSAALNAGDYTPGPIMIWNSHTGALITKLTGETQTVGGLAWAAGGKDLVSLASGTDGLRVWNISTGKLVYAMPLTKTLVEITQLTLSPNGQYLAVDATSMASPKDNIEILQISTHRVVNTLKVPLDTEALSWAPDSTRLATAAEGGVQIWNAFTGQHIFTYQEGNGQTGEEGNEQTVLTMAWSPDGKDIAIDVEQHDPTISPPFFIALWVAP